jgi:DNA polymerase elongation subunit (family B)
MYVQSGVRKGLLARMLSELLDTRVMVKQAMKTVNGDKVNIASLCLIPGRAHSHLLDFEAHS